MWAISYADDQRAADLGEPLPDDAYSRQGVQQHRGTTRPQSRKLVQHPTHDHAPHACNLLPTPQRPDAAAYVSHTSTGGSPRSCAGYLPYLA
jgi:hypothetical protein